MVTRGKHILHFNELDKAASAHRLSALHTVMQPVITLASTHLGSNEWVSKFSATVKPTFIWCYFKTFFSTDICFFLQYNLLNNSLPLNIHILTLEHWRKDQILLRVEHIFERDEDRFLSLPETIRLQVIIMNSHIIMTYIFTFI